MAFHNRLKEARIAAHLTQKNVSDAIGISKSTYSGYETGNSEPSMAIISKLMNLLNVSPSFLLQDEMNESLDSEKKLYENECLESKRIGERIMEKRKSLNMTQVEVAKRAGISQSALSDIEKLTKNPSISTIELLASALSCSVAELLGDPGASASATTPDESELLALYRLLNFNGKQLAIKTLQNFSENPVMQINHQSASALARQRADEAEQSAEKTKAHA